jgi:hypothetical protein
MAKIISPRVGTPGDDFDETAAAEAGINVQALIDGGFISTSGSNKSAKTKTSSIEE